MTLQWPLGADVGSLSRRRFLAGAASAGWCASCAPQPGSGSVREQAAQHAAQPAQALMCERGYVSSQGGLIPYTRQEFAAIKVLYSASNPFKLLPENRFADVPTARSEIFVLPSRSSVRVAIRKDYVSQIEQSTPIFIQKVWGFAAYIYRIFLSGGFFMIPGQNNDLIPDRPEISINIENNLHDGIRGYVALGDGNNLTVHIDGALADQEAFLVLAHEMTHFVQWRFDQGNAWDDNGPPVPLHEGLTAPNIYASPRGDLREGTARALEEVLVPGSARFRRDTARWFSDPVQTLVTASVKPFLIRPVSYSAGLFFKYIADQAAIAPTGAARESRALSAILEFCRATPAVNLESWRKAFLRLKAPGAFDRFAYLDATYDHMTRDDRRRNPGAEYWRTDDRATVPVSDETIWGNFIVAVLLHGGQESDPRFILETTGQGARLALRYRFPDGHVFPIDALPSVRLPGTIDPGRGGNGGSVPPDTPKAAATMPVTPHDTFALMTRASAETNAASEGATQLPNLVRPIGRRLATTRTLEIAPSFRADDIFASGYWVRAPVLGIPTGAEVNEARPPLHVMTPYSFMAWKVVLGTPIPGRMLRVSFQATASMEDALVQIMLVDARGRLLDLHRCDGSLHRVIMDEKAQKKWDAMPIEIDRVVACRDAAECIVAIASRERSGCFNLRLSRVVERAFLFAAPWNSVAGTSFSTGPRSLEWTWRSPDLWIDDAGVPTLRLYNFGDRAAGQTQVKFWKRTIYGEGRMRSLAPHWEEMLDSEGKRAAPVRIPSDFECLQRNLYRIPADSERDGWCGDWPDLARRIVSLTVPRFDTRRHLIRATVESPDNADDRPLEIVTSPAGVRPPAQDHVWTGEWKDG